MAFKRRSTVAACLCAALFAVFAILFAARAAVPLKFSYQGYLTTSAGVFMMTVWGLFRSAFGNASRDFAACLPGPVPFSSWCLAMLARTSARANASPPS